MREGALRTQTPRGVKTVVNHNNLNLKRLDSSVERMYGGNHNKSRNVHVGVLRQRW